MITVLRLDRLTDLTRFQGEGGIFKFAYHDTASEPAQGSSGIQIVFGCQGIPFFSGFEFGKEFICGFFRFDQNVARVDLFGFKNTILHCFFKQFVFHDGVSGEVLQVIERDPAVITQCQNSFCVPFKFRVFVFFIIGDRRIDNKGFHPQNSGFLSARVFIVEHGLQAGVYFVFRDFHAGFFGFTVQNDIVGQFLDRSAAKIGFAIFAEDRCDL